MATEESSFAPPSKTLRLAKLGEDYQAFLLQEKLYCALRSLSLEQS